MTAAHIYDSYKKFQEDVKKVNEINEINANRTERPGAPSSMVKLDPKFIVNHSFWWGWDGVHLTDGYYDRQIDILIGRLANFNPSWVREYPILRDPGTLRPGTSICRSGFPFLDIKSTWNESNGTFQIPRINSKEVIFPNNGMHTRTVNRGKSRNGNFDMRYVETSTPGLRGQSGGPIYDSEGRIYGMQVNTVHIPLGFHPTVEYQGNTVVENQFMNVGLGVHIGTIRDVLDSRHVHYDSEDKKDEYRIVG